MNELVSIIVPTLNGGRNLESLLRSLIGQSYKNFEVIVNDDIRTEDITLAVVNKYSAKFKILYIQKNRSMAQGRKSGSKFAHGKYQLHLDTDMELSPRVLESCLKGIKQGYDALVIPEVSFGEGYWSKVKAFERSMYIGDDLMESLRFLKSSVYKAAGGHNEKMVLSEDKDLDLRVRKAGFKVGRVSEPIYHNEGRLSLRRDLQKKFFYGKTAHVFIAENPKHAIIQANLIFRPAYFRNWKKIISNPLLSIGMFIMKTLETFAAFLGLIASRVNML